MDLGRRRYVFVLGVFAKDVVLDLVVRRKPKLAVGALTWFVLHGFIVRRNGGRSPGTSVLIALHS